MAIQKHKRNTKGIEPFKFKKGESGNPNGRPRGSKNLSSIIREFEEEDFDYSKLPYLNKNARVKFGEIGAPFRAVVYVALEKGLKGDVKAMEWLRKAGYGDKIDLTSKGQRLKQEPVIVSTIKPRNINDNAETETETTTSP